MSLSDQQWCPTSVQVTVLQARGLRIKGKSGTNDAYAVMQVGKEKYQTSVVEKSVAPVWKEEASFDLPPLLLQGGGGKERGSLHVQVLHRALVGPDKLLGQAVINLLQLSEDKTRNKTEWFKLLDKTGKTDKDRGEVLLDIKFMRNNMTASMFDLSAAGKSRSRLGKLKDKVRGKKKELDSSSGVVPSITQVLTDSEEEDASGGGEGGASKDGKSKQHKRMSLFSPKSNLQRNMSQSMSVLPAKNSSLSGSQSSGLNVDSSEGKKKFKFKIHKHSSSSDSKDSSSGQQKQEPSSLCINGSHVYCEEPPPRTSRTGSSFSLSSSGRESMDDVPDNSSPSVNSLKAVKEHSSWMEEEEEEEDENIEDLRKEEEEKAKLEKDIRREEKEDAIGKQQGKLERLAEERLRRDEEEKVRKQEEEHQRWEERRRLEEQERRKLEEEKRCREEEERIKKAEERAQERRQEEERKLAVEKSRLKEEEERKIEEEKVRREQERAEEQRKKEQAEKRQREEEMRIEEEKKASREKEHARREEEKRIEAEEKFRKAEEERIKMEEERKRKEHEEKLAKRKELEEKEMRKEQEKMQREEEERKKKVEEERRKVEEDRARRENEERIQIEKIRREEEEKKKTEEEERKRKQEELERLAKEKLKQEEERRKVEEERARREEDKIQKEKIREEEERKKKEESKIRQDELERLAREKLRQEEEERRKNEEQARREEDRIQEEKIREEEKAKKKMEEEMREEKRKEEEERIKNEEQKTFKKEEEKGKREEKERIEEKWRAEEREKQRTEEEKVRRQEEERIKREEKAEKERREDEERKQERLTKEKKENKIKEEQTIVGTKLRLRVPTECTSTNPFDESFSPEETHTPSKATTDDQRNPSAVSSEERGAVFTNDRDPINAQRDKRVAPKPPGRNQPEVQKEEETSVQHLLQINKQIKDKNVKTVSVAPQHSLTIAPLNRSSKDLKNNESVMENDSTKESTTKHNKRPAPAIPCTAEDELHRDVLEMKEDRASYSLNPFEDDDENKNDLTVHNDETNSGKTDPVSWPAVKSQTAEKDATKIKSSKMARAPLPPAQNDTPSSSMISQNHEESKVSDDIRVAAPNKACNPQEVKSHVQFQESPNKESKQIVTVAGVKEGGPPAGSRRLQPVKPLNPLEQQSDSVKVGNDNKATGFHCNGVQHKTNPGTERTGPYSQLTREELIALLLKQEHQLSERDKKISELERYIDNLLVRVIEEKPSILMSMSSLKKAA
ncbi:trichohyalin-like [Girardinichthys multiradiatus]|nr:trichohyalin-like [Girardinichthys multiradiatus]